jgi:hypothetical protein
MSKPTLLFVTVIALASSAYPATISSFSISTTALNGTPCSASGPGPAAASCTSTGFTTLPEFASASATVTDNSLEVFAGSVHASSADAFASITHDDLYSVPVNGPVSVLLSLTCANQGSVFGQAMGHFSLGSTLVSPTVESIYGSFASQGSGLCGLQYQRTNPPPAFVVFLQSMNNVVRLQTHIDGVAHAADFDDRIFVQLTAAWCPEGQCIEPET